MHCLHAHRRAPFSPGVDLLFGVDRLAVESGLRQAEGLLQRSLGQRPRAPAIIRYWPKAKRTGNSITVNPIRIVDQFRQTLVSMAFGVRFFHPRALPALP